MLSEIEEQVNFLQQVQIFADLDKNDLGIIAGRLKFVEYPLGEVIFREGDEGDNLYFVVRGKLRITRFDEETKTEVEIAIMDVGDTVGEDALYFDKERSATVSALDATALYYLNLQDFKWLRENFPRVEPYLAAFTRTHEISSRLKINWLGEGEFINLISRRHPIRLIGEILVLSLLVSLSLTILTAVTLFFNQMAWLMAFVWIIGGGFALLGLGAIIWAWAEWRNDYFIVTNMRVVWRERILFRGTSRQETPLRTIQSMNIQTGNFFHRAIEVGDLIVRTFNSELFMSDVYHPEQMKELIQGFILRSRRRSERDQLTKIRQTIRDRLGIEGDETALEEPDSIPPVAEKQPGRFAIFKNRIVDGDNITYRKHWSIFLKNSLAPNIVFILSLIVISFLSAYLVINEIDGSQWIWWITAFATFVCFLWWLYEYEDWRNDLYRVTRDLIVDRDKKPFGKESYRSAPIKNIQSLGHEVPNLIGLILNVGNVYINVGDETFSFHGVYDPSVVHQDISRRMEELNAKQQQDQMQQENERMADWLEIYHEETKDHRFPWRNQDLGF